MKKVTLPLLLICLTAIVHAQNVGVGTIASPVLRLHVSSVTDSNLLLLENRNTLGIGQNASMYFKTGNFFTGAIKTIGTGTNSARLGVFTFGTPDINGLGERISILDGGNVGIGTTTPSADFDVNGTFRVRGNGAAAGRVLTSDASGNATWQNGGIVLPYEGTSSAAPFSGGLFKVTATGLTNAAYFEINNTGSNEEALFATTNGNNGTAIRGRNVGTGNAGWFTNNSNANTDPALLCQTYGTGGALEAMSFGSSLDIANFSNNNGRVARINGVGKGFFNGGTQTGGADVAEAFAVEGNRNTYEPGDVLVISTATDRTVAKSTAAYSTLVVGVYATKPGVLLTERMENESQSDLVPMGVVGVIPTKVCLEGGAIHRGDLLVTSSIIGHAMKGRDKKMKIGTVIGKALEDFTSGKTGIIKVLVNVR